MQARDALTENLRGEWACDPSTAGTILRSEYRLHQTHARSDACQQFLSTSVGCQQAEDFDFVSVDESGTVVGIDVTRVLHLVSAGEGSACWPHCGYVRSQRKERSHAATRVVIRGP
jgi:hypothetical protein